MKLDYSLKTPEERIAYVEKMLEEEDVPERYLSFISDYILFVADGNQTRKERKAKHPIITRNRQATVAKRQVSYEQMVETLESREDGLYLLIANDKNQFLDRKDRITDEDIDEIPGLRENLLIIERLKNQFKRAEKGRRFAIKRQIIETWQQIYILKASFKGEPARGRTVKNMAHMSLDENIYFDEDGYPQSDGMLTLFNPAHVSFLLCYYSQLKEECYEDFLSDMYYLLLDLEDLATKAFKDDEFLLDLLTWKVDGHSNQKIQELVQEKYNLTHTDQYYSTLWRKRIPKMIAEEAQKQYLLWYYTSEEYGEWKECRRCGQMKLAHPMFFSRNTSKDGYYSICKECRKEK